MKKNIFLKAVSWALLQSFCIESLSQAAPLAKPLDVVSAKKPAIRFQLPSSVAEIEDSYTDSNDKKLVYLIQDPHTNNSGQLNVAKTLDILFTHEKLKYIFLEAGSGNESLSFLRSFGTERQREVAAGSLLRKAIFQGTEYLDITSDHDFVLWGVEDMALYEKSVEAYRAAAKERDRFERHLNEIESTIKTLKPRIFFAELITVDNGFQKFKKEEISLSEWAEVLFRKAEKLKLNLDAYADIKGLLALQQREKEIDFAKANAEQAKALASLSRADQDEISALAEQKKSAAKYTGNHEAAKAYFALLEEKLGTSLKEYSELSKYLSYLDAAKALQAKGILADLEALKDAVYGALTVNADQRLLVQSDKMLEYLNKLFHQTLTPDEYQSYKLLRRDMNLLKLEGFLNRKIMDLRSFYEKAVFLETGYEDMLKRCESFYELTYERDAKFVENLTAKMQSENQEKAVLVTGGFHTSNLKHLLKKENISYISITPMVLNETDWKRYESVMLSMNLKALSAPSLKAMTNMPMRVGSRLALGDNRLMMVIASALGYDVQQRQLIKEKLETSFPSVVNRKAEKVRESHRTAQSVSRGQIPATVSPVRAVSSTSGVRLTGSQQHAVFNQSLRGAIEQFKNTPERDLLIQAQHNYFMELVQSAFDHSLEKHNMVGEVQSIQSVGSVARGTQVGNEFDFDVKAFINGEEVDFSRYTDILEEVVESVTQRLNSDLHNGGTFAKFVQEIVGVDPRGKISMTSKPVESRYGEYILSKLVLHKPDGTQYIFSDIGIISPDSIGANYVPLYREQIKKIDEPQRGNVLAEIRFFKYLAERLNIYDRHSFGVRSVGAEQIILQSQGSFETAMESIYQAAVVEGPEGSFEIKPVADTNLIFVNPAFTNSHLFYNVLNFLGRYRPDERIQNDNAWRTLVYMARYVHKLREKNEPFDIDNTVSAVLKNTTADGARLAESIDKKIETLEQEINDLNAQSGTQDEIDDLRRQLQQLYQQKLVASQQAGARLAGMPTNDGEWRSAIRAALEAEFQSHGFTITFSDQNIQALLPLFQKFSKKEGEIEKTAAAVRRAFARRKIDRASQGMNDTRLLQDTITAIGSRFSTFADISNLGRYSESKTSTAAQNEPDRLSPIQEGDRVQPIASEQGAIADQIPQPKSILAASGGARLANTVAAIRSLADSNAETNIKQQQLLGIFGDMPARDRALAEAVYTQIAQGQSHTDFDNILTSVASRLDDLFYAEGARLSVAFFHIPFYSLNEPVYLDAAEGTKLLLNSIGDEPVIVGEASEAIQMEDYPWPIILSVKNNRLIRITREGEKPYVLDKNDVVLLHASGQVLIAKKNQWKDSSQWAEHVTTRTAKTRKANASELLRTVALSGARMSVATSRLVDGYDVISFKDPSGTAHAEITTLGGNIVTHQTGDVQRVWHEGRDSETGQVTKLLTNPGLPVSYENLPQRGGIPTMIGWVGRKELTPDLNDITLIRKVHTADGASQFAIHGFFDKMRWKFVSEGQYGDETMVTLMADTRDYPAVMTGKAPYFGEYRVYRTYTITKNSLKVKTRIENYGKKDIQIGFGDHPFFLFKDPEQVTASITALGLRGKQSSGLSDNTISSVTGTDDDYSTPKNLKAVDYTLTNMQVNEAGQAVTVFRNPATGEKVVLTQSDIYSNLHLFVPLNSNFPKDVVAAEPTTSRAGESDLKIPSGSSVEGEWSIEYLPLEGARLAEANLRQDVQQKVEAAMNLLGKKSETLFSRDSKLKRQIADEMEYRPMITNDRDFAFNWTVLVNRLRQVVRSLNKSTSITDSNQRATLASFLEEATTNAGQLNTYLLTLIDRFNRVRGIGNNAVLTTGGILSASDIAELDDILDKRVKAYLTQATELLSGTSGSRLSEQELSEQLSTQLQLYAALIERDLESGKDSGEPAKVYAEIERLQQALTTKTGEDFPAQLQAVNDRIRSLRDPKAVKDTRWRETLARLVSEQEALIERWKIASGFHSTLAAGARLATRQAKFRVFTFNNQEKLNAKLELFRSTTDGSYTLDLWAETSRKDMRKPIAVGVPVDIGNLSEDDAFENLYKLSAGVLDGLTRENLADKRKEFMQALQGVASTTGARLAGDMSADFLEHLEGDMGRFDEGYQLALQARGRSPRELRGLYAYATRRANSPGLDETQQIYWQGKVSGYGELLGLKTEDKDDGARLATVTFTRPVQRVVFADDEEGPHAAAKNFFASISDISVQYFTSGREVLRYLDAHPDEVDLVILDVGMPYDGTLTARDIRANRMTRAIPIIFQSHSRLDEMYLQALGNAATAGGKIGEPESALFIQNAIQNSRRLQGARLAENALEGALKDISEWKRKNKDGWNDPSDTNPLVTRLQEKSNQVYERRKIYLLPATDRKRYALEVFDAKNFKSVHAVIQALDKQFVEDSNAIKVLDPSEYRQLAKKFSLYEQEFSIRDYHDIRYAADYLFDFFESEVNILEQQNIVDQINRELAEPGTGDFPMVAAIQDLHNGARRLMSLVGYIYGLPADIYKDIHSLDDLRRLLVSHNIDQKNVSVRIVGLADQYDRGPDAVGTADTVRWIAENGHAKFFIGNHDFWRMMSVLQIHRIFDAAGVKYDSDELKNHHIAFWAKDMAQHAGWLDIELDQINQRRFNHVVAQINRQIDLFNTPGKKKKIKQLSAIALDRLRGEFEEVLRQKKEANRQLRSKKQQNADDAAIQAIPFETLPDIFTETSRVLRETIEAHNAEIRKLNKQNNLRLPEISFNVITRDNFHTDPEVIERTLWELKNFRLFYVDTFGNLHMHNILPLKIEGGFDVTYKGKNGLEALELMAQEVRDFFEDWDTIPDDPAFREKMWKKLGPIFEIINSWYSDKPGSVHAKAENVKSFIDRGGLETLGLGILGHFTQTFAPRQTTGFLIMGHNERAKFEGEKSGLPYFYPYPGIRSGVINIDYELSPGYSDRGAILTFFRRDADGQMTGIRLWGYAPDSNVIEDLTFRDIKGLDGTQTAMLDVLADGVGFMQWYREKALETMAKDLENLIAKAQDQGRPEKVAELLQKLVSVRQQLLVLHGTEPVSDEEGDSGSNVSEVAFPIKLRGTHQRRILEGLQALKPLGKITVADLWHHLGINGKNADPYREAAKHLATVGYIQISGALSPKTTIQLTRSGAQALRVDVQERERSKRMSQISADVANLPGIRTIAAPEKSFRKHTSEKGARLADSKSVDAMVARIFSILKTQPNYPDIQKQATRNIPDYTALWTYASMYVQDKDEMRRVANTLIDLVKQDKPSATGTRLAGSVQVAYFQTAAELLAALLEAGTQIQKETDFSTKEMLAYDFLNRLPEIPALEDRRVEGYIGHELGNLISDKNYRGYSAALEAVMFNAPDFSHKRIDYVSLLRHIFNSRFSINYTRRPQGARLSRSILGQIRSLKARLSHTPKDDAKRGRLTSQISELADILRKTEQQEEIRPLSHIIGIEAQDIFLNDEEEGNGSEVGVIRVGFDNGYEAVLKYEYGLSLPGDRRYRLYKVTAHQGDASGSLDIGVVGVSDNPVRIEPLLNNTAALGETYETLRDWLNDLTDLHDWTSESIVASQPLSEITKRQGARLVTSVEDQPWFSSILVKNVRGDVAYTVIFDGEKNQTIHFRVRNSLGREILNGWARPNQEVTIANDANNATFVIRAIRPAYPHGRKEVRFDYALNLPEDFYIEDAYRAISAARAAEGLHGPVIRRTLGEGVYVWNPQNDASKAYYLALSRADSNEALIVLNVTDSDGNVREITARHLDLVAFDPALPEAQLLVLEISGRTAIVKFFLPEGEFILKSERTVFQRVTPGLESLQKRIAGARLATEEAEPKNQAETPKERTPVAEKPSITPVTVVSKIENLGTTYSPIKIQAALGVIQALDAAKRALKSTPPNLKEAAEKITDARNASSATVQDPRPKTEESSGTHLKRGAAREAMLKQQAAVRHGKAAGPQLSQQDAAIAAANQRFRTAGSNSLGAFQSITDDIEVLRQVSGEEGVIAVERTSPEPVAETKPIKVTPEPAAPVVLDRRVVRAEIVDLEREYRPYTVGRYAQQTKAILTTLQRIEELDSEGKYDEALKLFSGLRSQAKALQNVDTNETIRTIEKDLELLKDQKRKGERFRSTIKVEITPDELIGKLNQPAFSFIVSVVTAKIGWITSGTHKADLKTLQSGEISAQVGAYLSLAGNDSVVWDRLKHFLKAVLGDEKEAAAKLEELKVEFAGDPALTVYHRQVIQELKRLNHPQATFYEELALHLEAELYVPKSLRESATTSQSPPQGARLVEFLRRLDGDAINGTYQNYLIPELGNALTLPLVLSLIATLESDYPSRGVVVSIRATAPGEKHSKPVDLTNELQGFAPGTLFTASFAASAIVDSLKPDYRAPEGARLLSSSKIIPLPETEDLADLKAFLAGVYGQAKTEGRLALLLRETVGIFNLKLEGSGSAQFISLYDDEGKALVSITVREAEALRSQPQDESYIEARGAASLFRATLQRTSQIIPYDSQTSLQGYVEISMADISRQLPDDSDYKEAMNLLFDLLAANRGRYYINTDNLSEERADLISGHIIENNRLRTDYPRGEVVSKVIFTNQPNKAESVRLIDNQLQLQVAGFGKNRLPNLIGALRIAEEVAHLYSSHRVNGQLPKSQDAEYQALLESLATSNVMKAMRQFSQAQGRITVSDLDQYFRGQVMLEAFILKPILAYLNEVGRALQLIRQSVDLSA